MLLFLQGGGETVYAQFDIWKENAIWGEHAEQSSSGFASERRESAAYAPEADPPPYSAYSQQSYCDMAYVLQV